MNEELSPNASIQCGVCSCAYHDPSNHCSLTKIHVDPIAGGATSKACDESMCGSYRCRNH